MVDRSTVSSGPVGLQSGTRPLSTQLRASRVVGVLWLTYAALVIGGWRAEAARGQAPNSGPEWLPATTVFYAELTGTSQLVELIMDHPLRREIEAIEPVREALQGPQFRDLQQVIGLIESRMQMQAPQLLQAVAGERVVVGFDLPTQAISVGIQSADANAADRLLATLIDLARQQAREQGSDDPIQEATFRETPVYRVGEARFARLGQWTWITSKDVAGRQFVNAHFDGRKNTLAEQVQFMDAIKNRAAGQFWAFANLDYLRIIPQLQNIPQRTDNPAGELLVGGFLDLAPNVPYITLALQVKPDQIHAQVQSPMDEAWKSENREYWWGSEERSTAPARLNVANSLAQVEFYRDISEMWMRGGDLFVEQTVDQLEQAESTLSTLFLGADFGQDILGAFEPEGHLIIARQEFGDSEIAPEIKLPAFALVFTLRDVEQMQPQLRRTFQSIIGFLNIEGAMNGRPQLDLVMDSENGGQTISGIYLPLVGDDRETVGAPIQYNFSPTIGFLGDRCVVSSSQGLARELLHADASVVGRTSSSSANTSASLQMKTLQAVLRDNQTQLIAQSMLDDGKSQADATRDIGLLIELIGWVDSLDFTFTHDQDNATLDLELRIRGTQGE